MIGPIVVLAGWTMLVLLGNLIVRVRAVRKRSISIKYFRSFNAPSAKGDIPDEVVILKNHLTNLFEVPILFYVITLLSLIYGPPSQTQITCAWLFVAARLVHTGVHLTYNNIMHRLIAFVVSNLFLIALWMVTILTIPTT